MFASRWAISLSSAKVSATLGDKAWGTVPEQPHCPVGRREAGKPTLDPCIGSLDTSLRGLRPMELVHIMRSQWAQALVLSPSRPVPLQAWDSRENPFSSSEFFPEESVTCQKAEWGVGELLHLTQKWPGWLEPVLTSWAVGDGRKCPGLRKLLALFTFPTKGLGTKSLASASSGWTQ